MFPLTPIMMARPYTTNTIQLNTFFAAPWNLLGTKGTITKELAYMQLGESIGKWAVILAGIFSLLALLTTFWTNTLALRDVASRLFQ